MGRPHIAAVVEDAWHGQLNGALQRSGWRPRVIAHTGYGSRTFVRVLSRVVLSRYKLAKEEARPHVEQPVQLEKQQLGRGWRAFVTAQAVGLQVQVQIGERTWRTTTDRSGYVDVTIEGHELEPGWREVLVIPEGGKAERAPVMILGDEVSQGIVSDIDDTVMITMLPRMFIAAWNTFVLHESARHIVPGMAPMYRDLLADHPGAPIFYLSTGAWNTAPTLSRFLNRHGYPRGPLLLTDWGPTNTGWFRSGQDHKRENLHRLAREFPDIQWILVGDDGQHDPKIYGAFAHDRPDVVRAIAIRELTPAEQVLSHGLPVSNEELGPRLVHGEVPVVRAPDGYGLLPKVQRVLGRGTGGAPAAGPLPHPAGDGDLSGTGMPGAGSAGPAREAAHPGLVTDVAAVRDPADDRAPGVVGEPDAGGGDGSSSDASPRPPRDEPADELRDDS